MIDDEDTYISKLFPQLEKLCQQKQHKTADLNAHKTSGQCQACGAQYDMTTGVPFASP